MLSLCNAEVLCTGAALTLDAARRAEAAAQEAAASICALALRRSCFLGPFLGLFLGPFLGPSFSAPFSPPLSEKNKSALPELTDINAQDAGGGEAGSSSTEAPRTSAKLAATQDQTRHRRAIIEIRRTASWMARRVSSGSVVTCRNDPDLQQKSKPVSVWSTRRSVTKPPSIPEVPKAGLSESARSPMRRPDSTGCVVATRGE